MKPMHHELKSILECEIETIKKGKMNPVPNDNQTLIEMDQSFDLLIHRPLNTLETTLVKRWLDKNTHVESASLLLDPNGYKDSSYPQKFPITLWRILYKESSDEVKQILSSTFETDEIIHLNKQESVVLVTKNVVSPYDLLGTLEAEALTSAKVIVGNEVKQPSECYASYRQLVEITELALLFKQKAQVITYEALLFPLLIKQLKDASNYSESASFDLTVRAHVRPVNDTELEHTALVFFDNNLNITETANELYIHRNTLIYRLNKLEVITGYDIRKFNDAINYYLSYLTDKIK